jgi:hypothetical protein
MRSMFAARGAGGQRLPTGGHLRRRSTGRFHGVQQPAFEGAAARRDAAVLSDTSLRLRFEVDVQLHEFNGAVGSELTDHREPRHEHADSDQDSIVVASGDQPRQIVEPDSEALHDPQQFEHLEVVCRGLALRTPLGGKLSIEVDEE